MIDEMNGLTAEERTRPLRLTIDPGFVNQRLIQTIMGENCQEEIDLMISQLPELAEWERRQRISHIYKDVLLAFCRALKIKTLSEIISKPGQEQLFCSTEQLGACPNIYDAQRTGNAIQPIIESQYKIELQYSTQHIVSDTLKTELRRGERIAIVGQIRSIQNDLIVIHPLLMGAPWIEVEGDLTPHSVLKRGCDDSLEVFIEDIEEFSKVKGIEKPKSPSLMEKISESAFKNCLTEILGDKAQKDWGGEQSDYFSSHLTIGQKRMSGAFLLKGPGSGFRPMELNHLGKNNDQIVRLATAPAGLLVVQHCHDIGPNVRATLKAFAVQPSNARRYCFIDGRDSLHILQAYNLYDYALG